MENGKKVYTQRKTNFIHFYWYCLLLPIHIHTFPLKNPFLIIQCARFLPVKRREIKRFFNDTIIWFYRFLLNDEMGAEQMEFRRKILILIFSFQFRFSPKWYCHNKRKCNCCSFSVSPIVNAKSFFIDCTLLQLFSEYFAFSQTSSCP